MKKVLLRLFLLVVFIISAVLLFNTFTSYTKQVAVPAVQGEVVNDSVLTRLSAALKIPSISRPFQVDTAALDALHQLIDSNYTRVGRALRRTRVNRYSLLYRWEGKNTNLAPVLIMAHQDVVPVSDETLGRWTYPPFSGAIAEGYVWGRGALDDKSSMMSILEAVELLLKNNFTPQRTIYFAFGHDEEVGGRMGAKAIASACEAEGLHFEFVLDEGLAITQGMLPGVKSDAALIGLAEKGYLTLQLTAHAAGGHSSTPPKQNAVGDLARAIAALEDNQMPARLDGPVGQLFDYAGPEMDFGHKLVFANRWLFGPLIKSQLSAGANTNALIRTTTAPTMIESGIAENVLPNTAIATVNFRIRPGENTDDVIAHVKRVIANDSVTVSNGPTVSNPTKVASTEAFGFQIVQTTIKQIFPDVITCPSLVLGATDARYFDNLADNCYRFYPNRVNAEDLKRVHGINERISTNNYKGMIQFYCQLMKNL